MFLTGQNVLVSVLVFVLRSLALLTTVEQLALLLLQSLDEKQRGESSREISQPTMHETEPGEL